MASVNEKIVQCKKDLVAVQANLTKLEAKKKLENSKWIAAVAGDRLILNLSALSSTTKNFLKDAIVTGECWISFVDDGGYGYSRWGENDGLKFYQNTKIVFGDK